MAYTGRANWLKKKGYKFVGETDSKFKAMKTVEAYREDGQPAQYVQYRGDLGYPYFEVYAKKARKGKKWTPPTREEKEEAIAQYEAEQEAMQLVAEEEGRTLWKDMEY